MKINPSKPAHKFFASPHMSSPEQEGEPSASTPQSALLLFYHISSDTSVIPYCS